MSDPERTRGEALRGAKYDERLHFLHCRFYKKIRTTMVVVGLATGSAAIASAIQAIPFGVAASAVLVAVMSIIDATGNFAEKAAKHNVWRRMANDLIARSASLSMEEIDAERSKLEGEVDDEIESLRAVAWNDVLVTVGMEHGKRPETRIQQLMRVLA